MAIHHRFEMPKPKRVGLFEDLEKISKIAASLQGQITGKLFQDKGLFAKMAAEGDLKVFRLYSLHRTLAELFTIHQEQGDALNVKAMTEGEERRA